MRIVTALFAAALTSLAYTNSAAGQDLTAGTLTGEVVSALAEAAGSTTVTVLDVPPQRFFVLTQSCFARNPQSLLDGSDSGRLPLVNQDCTVYTPGLVYEPGEILTYTNPVPPPNVDFVTVTGVLVPMNTPGGPGGPGGP
jgi:hypothetical protein